MKATCQCLYVIFYICSKAFATYFLHILKVIFNFSLFYKKRQNGKTTKNGKTGIIVAKTADQSQKTGKKTTKNGKPGKIVAKSAVLSRKNGEKTTKNGKPGKIVVKTAVRSRKNQEKATQTAENHQKGSQNRRKKHENPRKSCNKKTATV